VKGFFYGRSFLAETRTFWILNCPLLAVDSRPLVYENGFELKLRAAFYLIPEG